MQGELFTIGEIARIKGMTVKALRFYARIGLLAPQFIDPGSGYRYYSIGQFLRLDIIKAARAMEMSPKDIKVLLEKKDDEDLLERLRQQSELVEKKIEDLRRIRSMIGAARVAIGRSMASANVSGVTYKEIEERRVIVKTIDQALKPAALIVAYADFDGLISKSKLINAYETGIILGGDLASGYHPTGMFNSVIVAEGSDSSAVSSIPAGRFVCVSYSAADAGPQQAKLSAYMRRKRLNPVMILQVDPLNALLAPEPGAGRAELQVLCTGSNSGSAKATRS